jgi:hypothetical protein
MHLHIRCQAQETRFEVRQLRRRLTVDCLVEEAQPSTARLHRQALKAEQTATTHDQTRLPR